MASLITGAALSGAHALAEGRPPKEKGETLQDLEGLASDAALSPEQRKLIADELRAYGVHAGAPPAPKGGFFKNPAFASPGTRAEPTNLQDLEDLVAAQ